MGADLAFVFCATEACVPIKSYSPELMVTSFYNGVEAAERDDIQYPDPVTVSVSKSLSGSISASESGSGSGSGSVGAGALSDRKADPQRAMEDVSNDAHEKKVRTIMTCAEVKVASYGVKSKDDLNYLINFRAVLPMILSTVLSPSLQFFHFGPLFILVLSPTLVSYLCNSRVLTKSNSSALSTPSPFMTTDSF
jgi:hypothetical protein